jgi:uncharacterized protein (DUF2147 family)
MKLIAVAAIGLSMLSSAALADGAQGTWHSDDGGVKVRLWDRGGNKLCGIVVWLDEPIDRAIGRPKTDKFNPDPAKCACPD